MVTPPLLQLLLQPPLQSQGGVPDFHFRLGHILGVRESRRRPQRCCLICQYTVKLYIPQPRRLVAGGC